MPNQTFFNLPEEKRARIIDAAMQEFASYSFDQASIARIIENAGIPRGSFYQYFGNLKDLYKHIFDLMVEKKLNYFRANLPNFQNDNFNYFQTLHNLFATGIRFAQENPELLAIGNHFLKETNAALREEILGEQIPKGDPIYAQMIRKGIELGQLDPSIDQTIATLYMRSLNNTITDYYISVVPEPITAMTEDNSLLPLVDQVIYLLANGLKAKSI